ncbi:MAG TPA: hypothetical protein VKP60_02310 [Magnetospirillaceae bacterium]|nr:hypothetical protein [Magnetospirillaceae bacterium]
MAKTISARQRKLVQDGAKGVAERWVGNPEEAARDGVKFRSSVKRYSGKEAEQPKAEATPQARARKRSIRAEQAATGMMGPPPTTFDEGAIKDWLGKMSVEDLQKLSRLAEIARQGKEGGKAAWNKVDNGLKQQAVHVEVNGGNVTVNNTVSPPPRGQWQGQRGHGQGADWGRRLARIKDFING